VQFLRIWPSFPHPWQIIGLLFIQFLLKCPSSRHVQHSIDLFWYLCSGFTFLLTVVLSDCLLLFVTASLYDRTTFIFSISALIFSIRLIVFWISSTVFCSFIFISFFVSLSSTQCINKYVVMAFLSHLWDKIRSVNSSIFSKKFSFHISYQYHQYRSIETYKKDCHYPISVALNPIISKYFGLIKETVFRDGLSFKKNIFSVQ